MYMLYYQVTGWPGQQISVSMRLVDELNFSTAGIVELTPRDSSNVVSLIKPHITANFHYC